MLKSRAKHGFSELQNNAHTPPPTLKPLEMVRQSYIAKSISNFFKAIRSPIPVGSTGKQLEQLAIYYLHKYGCVPALRDYQEFPADISVNVNNTIAHGIPSDTSFESDDVVVLDIVATQEEKDKKKLYADSSWSFCVGTPSAESKYLIASAWNISRAAACAVKEGGNTTDIAYAVEEAAFKYKVHVYVQFTGHGIGRNIHQFPQIRYDLHTSIRITSGMVLCIEPIVSLSSQKVKKEKDGSYVGVKKHKAAVFEHMIGVFPSRSLTLSYGLIPPEDIPKYK